MRTGGVDAVPAGEIATIVTRLEMRERPRPRPIEASPLDLVRWPAPTTDAYRALFRRVGAPWLWFSRLTLDDAALAAILADSDVEVYAVVDRRGIEVGLVELDRRRPPVCAIGYFGLVPELAGQGHGRAVMARTLQLAWGRGIERVTVATCTLDHPRALGFYRAQGFVAIERAVERFADPRLTGVLPRDAAPHVPLIERALDHRFG